MKSIIISKKEDGKKIINVIQTKFPKCSLGTIHRALRNKDIKINGTRIKENLAVYDGDEVEIFIIDELLMGKSAEYKIDKKRIIFEDDNVLIYNKPQEIEVQKSKNELGLEDFLKKEYNFIKACHRLDRNTSGLVIFAKNKEAEEEIIKLIKEKKINKFYKALVYGIPKNKVTTLKAYLFKDSKKSSVIISDVPKKGYQEIITRYKILEEDKKNNTALLEVELITGRTHQIRAHLAHIGYPIIGDGKYGINKVNKEFGKKYQELEAFKLVFLDTIEGALDYLAGKIIKI